MPRRPCVFCSFAVERPNHTIAMAADHGLDSIVATNVEDWHYEIPDGYFDNIEGTKAGIATFIRSPFSVPPIADSLFALELMKEYQDHELVKEAFNILSKVRLHCPCPRWNASFLTLLLFAT